MKVSNHHIAESLYEVLKDAHSKHVSQIADNFSQYLVSIRRLSAAEVILQELETIEKEKEGNVTATVVSRFPLSKKIKTAIASQIGKSVELIEEQDVNMLGGVIIKMNNVIYDGSVNTAIRQLKQSLI